MLHMDVSVGRVNPDDLSLPAIHFNLRAAALCPSATLRCFSILPKELSKIACDMHEKTSRNDLKHTKDLTERFQSSFRFVLLDLIRHDKAIGWFPGFPPSIGLLACQAPPKTAMHDASLRKKHRASLLEFPAKTEPRCLERQKCPRCGAQKKQAVPKCIEAPCAFHKKMFPNFFLSKHF